MRLAGYDTTTDRRSYLTKDHHTQWSWVKIDRATGQETPLDEWAVRVALCETSCDLDRAIDLGYGGENLETATAFYEYRRRD